MIWFQILAGFGLLLMGGEATLRGAIGLGEKFGMPKLLIGIVIVGFGTSLPELLVAIDAVTAGVPQLAVGNVIGSNISNALLILGVSALVSPIGKPARVLLPNGVVTLTAAVIIVLLGLQGEIFAWQGGAMLIVLVGLIVSEYLRAREENRLKRLLTEPVPLPTEVPAKMGVAALLTCSGIVSLVFGADLLVNGASSIARMFGVTEGLIGLTVVSLGSTLPELVSATVASYRGNSEMAYGNVLGSILFNLLGILGVASLVGTLTFPFTMVWFDGPVMISAIAVTIWFLTSKDGLSRFEGGVLVAGYAAYVGMRYAYALL